VTENTDDQYGNATLIISIVYVILLLLPLLLYISCYLWLPVCLY